MPKQPNRRLVTGNRRRLPVRRMSHNRRHMALSHEQVGFMMMLQQQILGNWFLFITSISPLHLSACAYMFAKSNPELFLNVAGNVDLIFTGLAGVNMANFVYHISQFYSCYHLDYLLHDITPQEEASHVGFVPRNNIRLLSWSDQECYQKTGFNKCKLYRIYRCFGLQTIADHNDGFIRVYTGAVHGCGTPCYYLFDPEEIFLYFMTGMKKGLPYTDMCNLIFGGSPKRWSPAWRCIFLYLDNRYRNVIGHQGLVRFLDDFPRFYSAIQHKVRQTEYRHNIDGTMNEVEGLNFLPFDIFGFIDCSIDRICRPFSGPDGDYEGAPRKEPYARTQRAFYTGYKKCHGIKVETVLLPNGISTVFGPVSARLHDTASMLNMSGLNRFLIQIQRNRQHRYQVMGDGVYGMGFLECVRSYF